ncbi:MAG: transporter substrate-binding domain-containing protein, partial [Bacilli bacterium]|nr:transporter substrate-binding domain-containing protein [Bacilli bacterium]
LFLSNLKIGYMIDGNVVGVIQQMGLLDNYIGVASNKDILLQIKNGELDAGIMRHNIGTTILDELNISNIKARYSLSPSYMCFAINGDKASLAAKINDVLDEMRLNGELNKLNNMWQIAGMNDHVAKPIDVNNLKKATAKLHIR